MSYKIFLSHASPDKLIAQEVMRVVNNAFEGDIEVYLAFRELAGGRAWKEELRHRLDTSDAIMSIVTADSISKPWLYVEWSAFWLQDRKYYILLVDDIKVSDLFQPMQDRQATRLLDAASVRLLFRALSEDSGHGAIPYGHVQELIDSVRDTLEIKIREVAEQSFAKFRDEFRELPSDDREKDEVASFFLDSGELDHFLRVCREIRDDSIKTKFLYKLIRKGQIDIASNVLESVRSGETLGEVSRELMDLGYSNTAEFRKLIEAMSEKNQAELRKLLIHLVDRGEEGTKLFHSLVTRMTNMAELRKVADYLVQNRNLTGDALFCLIDLIAARNRAELRKLAFEFIANGLQREQVFMKLARQLAIGNQREMEKVMVELYHHDQDLFRNLLNEGLITNERVLARLQQLVNGRE